MEGDETENLLLGKLDAHAPSPIWKGYQDGDLYFVDEAIEGDGVGESHKSVE